MDHELPTVTARYLKSAKDDVMRLLNPKGFDDPTKLERLQNDGLWIRPDVVRHNFEQHCKVRRVDANGDIVEVISPAAYYKRRVFVWIPRLFNPPRKMPCATCGGMNTSCHADFHWRRVRALPEDYYILTERY